MEEMPGERKKFMSERSESNASNCSAWKWKHNDEPVNVAWESSDRIYYKVEVIRFHDKKFFKKVTPKQNEREQP